MDMDNSLLTNTSQEDPLEPIRRNLALYPECAMLQKLTHRVTCCDTKVKSVAGREFCYSDVIYADDKFDECFFDDDDLRTFQCCDDFGGINLSLSYSCKE